MVTVLVGLFHLRGLRCVGAFEFELLDAQG
jgi:hypothetical protein